MQISSKEIERAYGGVETSRGYYSTLFSSSANAYMLMYRQINHERNAGMELVKTVLNYSQIFPLGNQSKKRK